MEQIIIDIKNKILKFFKKFKITETFWENGVSIIIEKQNARRTKSMKKTKEMKMGLMGVMMALLVCLLWVRPVKVMAADTQVSAGLTIDTAPQVEIGIPYMTSFTTSDKDKLQHVWLKFTTPNKKAFYTVNAKNFNVQNHFGFTVRTAMDEELAVDYSRYSSGGEEIGVEVALEPVTTYYLEFDGSTIGNFRFTIDCYEDQVGDTKETATPLTIDTDAVSSIDAVDSKDIDYFSFVAGNYDKYLVTVKNLNNSGRVHAIVLTKYDEELGHCWLWENEDSVIELQNLNPGETYYIALTSGNKGNYRVCVNPQRTSVEEGGVVAAVKSKVEYNGKVQTPAVSVKLNNEDLQKDVDYRLEYSNNKNIGTAYVKVIGLGNYSDSKTLSFKILPKKTGALTVKSAKKSQASVSWAKDNAVSGYYIQYSKDSSFRDGVKKVSVNKKNATTIKGLQSKRTYYVRVASYKKVGGKTYVGKYSAAKKIRIK